MWRDNKIFYLDEQGNRGIVSENQASIDGSGAIYVLGRYKDLVIRAGENLSPALIEASLNKVQRVL